MSALPRMTVFLVLLFLTAMPSFSAAKEAIGLRTVDRSQICMVADKIPGEEILKLTLDNKTYYVCCPNCGARITNNKDIRYAIDPVTGKKVDKAKAYTVADSNDEILYFQSRKTAREYLDRLEKRHK